MKDFRKFLLRNHITPKWAIFATDLFICIVAVLIAENIVSGFDLSNVPLIRLFNDLLLTGFVCSAFFVFFKTYQGIIRYSDFKEAIRSVAALLCSFTCLLILKLIFSNGKSDYFLDIPVLTVFFFIASFLIFGYRLLVKHLYIQSIGEENISNVIICGADQNGAFLKKTIEHLAEKPYRVIAFIDSEGKYITKSIDNIEIFSYRQVEHLISLYNVKTLFFATQGIGMDIKNFVVDVCLAKKVTIMNIPPAKDWIHDNLKMDQLQQVKIDELLGRPSIELSNQHVIDLLFNRNVLITGAAGSIGSELARQVAAIRPQSVIICDKSETGLYELEYELQQNYSLGDILKVFLGDVKDEHAMRHMFDMYQPDIVFHAAAYKHVPMMEKHPCEAILNNVQGTKVLADLSEMYGVERFLFVSTDKAINPTNIMGASKRIAEIYCHALHARQENDFEPKDQYTFPLKPEIKRRKTKFIITRFGNVLGSNGSVIPRFQQQIASGGPVTVTHKDIIRYFMTIPEACSLVLEAVTIGEGGNLYLFDMGEPVKIIDLAYKMIKLAGKEPGKDIPIEITGLRPGEKLYEELLNKEEEVMPTHHKKILIAKVMEYDYMKLMPSVKRLLQNARVNNNEIVVKQIKNLVPEYISTNPLYEIDDEEISTRVIKSAF